MALFRAAAVDIASRSREMAKSAGPRGFVFYFFFAGARTLTPARFSMG
jgi:hypothetical protein